jgi:hypothetical protein
MRSLLSLRSEGFLALLDLRGASEGVGAADPLLDSVTRSSRLWLSILTPLTGVFESITGNSPSRADGVSSMRPGGDFVLIELGAGVEDPADDVPLKASTKLSISLLPADREPEPALLVRDLMRDRMDEPGER